MTNQLVENTILQFMSSLLPFTPLVLVMLVLTIVFYIFLDRRRFQKYVAENVREQVKQSLERRMDEQEFPRMTIHNNTFQDAERGGFAFLNIADEHKVFFVDAMNGFADFAKLKGYNVEISIDTSPPGKVGIRFVILDVGVTVSTTTVRNDVDDYVNRIHSVDNFSDMPMPSNSIEHIRLVSALQARFLYLQTQLEMQAVSKDFHKKALEEWSIQTRAIAYTIPTHQQNLAITIQTEGGSTMRDEYNANNSQGIAQGQNASANIKRSALKIGNTHSEKQSQITLLKGFEETISASSLPSEAKQKALRHAQNAREELEETKEPKPEVITKWLNRAKDILTTASAGADVIGKLNDVFTIFGLSSE